MEAATHNLGDLLGILNETERKHAPDRLYTLGDTDLLRRSPRVSIIGSRHASPDGLHKAAIIARLVVRLQGVVVSGLAQGIDTAAHNATIEAGGKTIAVIGTPVDRCYPKSNQALHRTIAHDHLLVSQFPIGYPVRPQNFAIRNRTMALLSDASVIVEASEKSGTEHQGWEAIRMRRLLLLPRKMVEESRFNWPREMCKYGAAVFDSLDVLQELVEEIKPASSPEPSEPPF